MSQNYGHESEKLDQHAWRIWVSIVLVSVTTTVGLGAILILDNEKIQSAWPWAQTDRALLACLALVVLSFALYLTKQQIRLINVRKKLVQAKHATEERLENHVQHLQAILNISRTMAANNDEQAVFDTIVEGCFNVFTCDNASLMLLDRKTQELVVRAACGHTNPTLVLGSRVPLGQGIAGRVAEARKPMIIDGQVDPEGFEGLSTMIHAPAASMVVPIALRGEILGVISVASYKNTQFREEDLHALTVFAEHAGVYCRHTEQARWMRETIQRLDGDLDKYQAGDKAA